MTEEVAGVVGWTYVTVDRVKDEVAIGIWEEIRVLEVASNNVDVRDVIAAVEETVDIRPGVGNIKVEIPAGSPTIEV